MSIRKTFPDVIIHTDGRVQLVTEDAQSWAWTWSGLGLQEWYTVDSIPRMLASVPTDTHYQMQDDGLVVYWPKTGPFAYEERVPEWRKKYPKWQGE